MTEKSSTIVKIWFDHHPSIYHLFANECYYLILFWFVFNRFCYSPILVFVANLMKWFETNSHHFCCLDVQRWKKIIHWNKMSPHPPKDFIYVINTRRISFYGLFNWKLMTISSKNALNVHNVMVKHHQETFQWLISVTQETI